MAISDRVKNLMTRLWMAENLAESEALLDAFEHETTEALRKALRDVLTLLDEGKLVRDISHDHESDWAIKQLPMIRTLANAAELAGLLQPAAQPTPEVKK